jgi:hypothetical protein
MGLNAGHEHHAGSKVHNRGETILISANIKNHLISDQVGASKRCLEVDQAFPVCGPDDILPSR